MIQRKHHCLEERRNYKEKKTDTKKYNDFFKIYITYISSLTTKDKNNIYYIVIPQLLIKTSVSFV